ncbi:hypothetical protein [Luteimonas terrae]|uniref:Uncharacterized protein n=1 Tax=Luteimonas terrae TaxID=1530191 RepID=A0ABU1XX69_9GAMM|nr:hypothetical protein [Luteimonas terrae]MDR7193364.1 hypothetical protein [Luteimonas terrae]
MSPAEDFEQRITVETQRAAQQAALIIKRHFDMQAFPKVDQHGVNRVGWNHPVDKRPMPVNVADLLLRSNLQLARTVLQERVFTALAKGQVSTLRLAALYALAETIGPERVRDMPELWAALEAGRWADVGVHIINCNWTGLVGSSDRNKQMFSWLLVALTTGIEPQGSVS